VKAIYRMVVSHHKLQSSTTSSLRHSWSATGYPGKQ